jgi:hypothetical protein
MITEVDGSEAQPFALLTTVNVYVSFGGKLFTVTVSVLPEMLLVGGIDESTQLPAGNPLRSTLPVGVVQVGWETTPTITGVGVEFTLMDLELLQPVAVSVKVRVAVPVLTPVTIPALVTVAMALSLLDQVPPELGVTLAVLPTQTSVAPPSIGLSGIGSIIAGVDGAEIHPSLLVTENV